MKAFDVIVVGAGPGGYVAAIRAAHHGLSAAVVERDPRLGGTCLLRGCIPTKSLLHSADLLEEIRGAEAHGILTGEVGFDFEKVQAARGRAVDKSAAGVAYLMRQNKITVLSGHGRLRDATTVEVTDAAGKVTGYSAPHIILATGSVPRELPFLPADGTHVLTSDAMLEQRQPPTSLVVLGAGAVGVEFASMYRRFGTEVTVVEMLGTLLPIEDTEISQEFQRAFKKRGITAHLSTKVESAAVKKGMVEVVLLKDDKRTTLRAEKLLVAVGRAPVTGDVGLATAGVRCDAGGYVEVDTLMRTSVPNIYAIGDVVRTPWLAHVATAEGILAVDHLAGKDPKPLNYLQVPSCTYASPEVASVGLTERGARERGYDVKVGKFPFSAIAKARILGQTEGMVKIVADKRYDEVLGVHIMGPRATDLIAEACVALRLEATSEELAQTIHAHPTLAESMLEAAHATAGRAMHL